MSVMKVFEDNLECKQTRTRYLVDCLKPPGYKGDCKVKNIKLCGVWRQCINEAKNFLAIHPSIGGQGSIGIFDQLFSEGATLLKPKGRSLQKQVECTLAGVFSLPKCTLEGTTIAHPSAMGLKHTQGAKLSGELLSFSRPNSEVALQWSGRFGPTIDVDAASTTFVDLDITDQGRWEVDPNILNTFIDAVAQDIKYCPVIVAEPYDGVKACDLRLADDV